MESTPNAAPIRVGLIGPGQIADERLIPALAQIPGVVFWSVLSRDNARASAFAAKHKAQAPHPSQTELGKFLSDPLLDAVIIATPDRLHASQAIAAAQAGKHVFLEKPMATSSSEAEQILKAVDAAKVKLAIGYHMRFHAGHQKVAELLKQRRIGDLKHMSISWTLKADATDWRAASDTGRWWSLGATGTHCLDLVRWLMTPSCGEGTVSHANIKRSEEGGGHDLTADVTLSFPSGATAHVTSSVEIRAPREFNITGTDGTIVCSETLGPRGTGTITVNGETLEFTPANPYTGELTDFIDSIRGGRHPLVDGREGYANIQMLEAATNETEVLKR